MIWTKKILLKISALLLIGCLAFILPIHVHAQKKERTRLKAYYEKLPNSDKKISLVLTQGSGKQIAGVVNAEIILSTFNLDEEIELTSLHTDTRGEAFLLVEAGYSFPKDEDGYSVVSASYGGNDSLRAAKKEVKFVDLNIDISFDIDDSVKLVLVSAFEIDSIGQRKPIKEVDLNIGVERLYSTLFLEKIETDEDGNSSFEFPNDIPGDSTGTINIVVFVEDHDDYGTITKSATINWGTLVDYSDHLIGRSLFGDEAPLWMIISVFIILTGAWFNFIRAIIRIVKIRKVSFN